jgi:hypothetical protein
LKIFLVKLSRKEGNSFIFHKNSWSIKMSTDCYRWRGDDEVNDRPVGKPQEEGMMNIAAGFSLSNKPRFIDPVGKSQTQEGDAC